MMCDDKEFLAFYDRVADLLRVLGCFHVGRSGLYALAPDTVEAHRWLDTLVSHGKITRLTPPGTWGQYEVYGEGSKR